MVSFNKRIQTPLNTHTHLTLIKTRTLVSSLFMLHVVTCKQNKNKQKTSIITYYNLGQVEVNEANCI